MQVAPPGSMDRHQRRVAVLDMCRLMMEGVTPDSAGVGRGCASSYPYETALRLLEIEEDVTDGGAPQTPVHVSEVEVADKVQDWCCCMLVRRVEHCKHSQSSKVCAHASAAVLEGALVAIAAKRKYGNKPRTQYLCFMPHNVLMPHTPCHVLVMIFNRAWAARTAVSVILH